MTAETLLQGAYVSLEAAKEALAHRTMFNVIDPRSGWKADLIIRKSRPFSETEFQRRQLEWSRRGGSERQLDDVRELLRLRGDELDRHYVGQWVAELSLRNQWELVCPPTLGVERRLCNETHRKPF